MKPHSAGAPLGVAAEARSTMPRYQQFFQFFGVGLPFLGLPLAIWLLWGHGVSAADLAIMASLYVLTGLGIGVGYHRLLTHRSFETTRGLRYTWAILGSLALEGSVIPWVAHHRKHHAFSDDAGDPHSPHGHGDGFRGALKGLAHAHLGWVLFGKRQQDRDRYLGDLKDDRGMNLISDLFPVFAVLTFGIPAALGLMISGSWWGALSGFVWGGLVRVFFLHHVTFAINSICHFAGRRAFATGDQSRNVFWLALPSLGEAWHNNHHAFPTSARHGLRGREIDVAGLAIAAMERLGLAWNVVAVNSERMQAKALPAARSTGARAQSFPPRPA
jgi:stearoyl-CoA desaturase (delta-9 desaturase)